MPLSLSPRPHQHWPGARGARPVPRNGWRSIRPVVVAVLLSAALAAGCKRADADVQTELQRQLASDPVTAPAHLTVTVDQGVARISGDIDTPAQQARAIEIARAVKGVIVAEPDMRLSDQGLARSVQQAIAADPDVGQVPLTVEATDGRVRLVSDQTNADQRAKLVEIAKGVEGVTAVEDRMR